MYAELFALHDLRNGFELWRIAVDFSREEATPISDSAIQTAVDNLLNLAALHGYKPEPFRADVEQWVGAAYAARGMNEKVRDNADPYPSFILERHEALSEALAGLPSDLTKARALLRAYLEDDPAPVLVAHALEFPECAGGVTIDREKVLRLCDDDPSDDIEGLEQHRLLRAAGRRADKGRLERFVATVRNSLRQFSVDLSDLDPDRHFFFGTVSQLIYAWMLSRERGLRGPLFGVGRQLANQLLRWQRPDGSCATGDDYVGDPPYLRKTSSALMTAIALNLAMAFGDPDEIEDHLVRGIEWLARHQRPDGSWTWREWTCGISWRSSCRPSGAARS